MGLPKGIHPTQKHPLRLLVLCNRVLTFVAILCVVYALINFFVKARQIPSSSSRKDGSASKDEVAEKIVLPQAKPFDAYVDIINKRDIFNIAQPKGATPSENPAEAEPLPAAAAQDWLKDLKLVGILLDKEPKAVIEDAVKNETVFLSHGQELRSAVLQDIQEDKVIFIYQGHRLELAF